MRRVRNAPFDPTVCGRTNDQYAGMVGTDGTYLEVAEDTDTTSHDRGKQERGNSSKAVGGRGC